MVLFFLLPQITQRPKVIRSIPSSNQHPLYQYQLARQQRGIYSKMRLVKRSNIGGWTWGKENAIYNARYP